MVKGGKDNRKQRQQRRRQRPKVFHRPNAATNTDVHDADASRQNEEVIESEPYRQNLTGRMKASLTLLLLMQIKHKTIQQI